MLLTAYVIAFFGLLNFFVAGVIGVGTDVDRLAPMGLLLLSAIFLVPTASLGYFAGYSMHPAPLSRWITLAGIPIGLTVGMLPAAPLPIELGAALLPPLTVAACFEGCVRCRLKGKLNGLSGAS